MDSEINGWKYKEVKSQKGQTIVFGRLDEFLLDYFHEKTIGGLDQHKSNYQEQYICNCPFCQSEGHTKKKLHILPNTTGVDDFSTGYCFVCGRTFVHITDKVEINYRVPSFMNIQKPFEILPMTDKLWTLDKFNDEFDFYSAQGVKYLEHRNPYLRDLWKPLGFKFYEDHIAMPFRDPEGNLIYYQIRFTDATEKGDIRYFFPKTESKPPYILQSSIANPENIIVVEGVFDAIAAMIQSEGKYVVIGCMGSKLSDYQLEFIRHFYMPKKILVWMDETPISLGIRDRLKTIFNYTNIQIIQSKGDDPEEILNHKLRTGQKINWITPEYGDPRGQVYFPKFNLGFM